MEIQFLEVTRGERMWELGTIWAEVECESTPSAKNSRKRGMEKGLEAPSIPTARGHSWLATPQLQEFQKHVFK